MGSLVFPAPAPPSWAIGWPIKKTPAYSTIVRTPASGRGEVRVALQQWPRWQFEVDVAYLRGDLNTGGSWLQQVIGFYGAVRGAADDWLYYDPYDNAVEGSRFGVGDGATTEFQLQREILPAGIAGPFPYGALDVIQNLNGTPTIYVAGTATTPGSISSTGLITFSAAPASGASLTWSGSFYFRCRFMDDSLSSLQEDLYQLWSLKGLRFESVIL